MKNEGNEFKEDSSDNSEYDKQKERTYRDLQIKKDFRNNNEFEPISDIKNDSYDKDNDFEPLEYGELKHLKRSEDKIIRHKIKLEKIEKFIREGGMILDGGLEIDRIRQKIKNEKHEKFIREGGRYLNSENLQGEHKSDTEQIENPNTNSEKSKLETKKCQLDQLDTEKIIEKIARHVEKIAVDKDNLSELLDILKHDKNMTLKQISDEIGYDVVPVLNRGYSLPKESFDKLKDMAKSIEKSLEVKKVIQKNTYDINSMKKLASLIGQMKSGVPGNCLSEKYEAMNKQLIWECGKCEKIWKATPNGILYLQRWCRKCANQETWTYEEMQQLARNNGMKKTGVKGELLTSKEAYENQAAPDRSKFEWKCGKCGSSWEATASNVKRGSWCKTCQYDKLAKKFRAPYEEIIEVAGEVGKLKTGKPGKFLATKDEYENVKTPSHTKFKWYCGGCDDTFEMDITHVKRPQWCPTCTEGESETVCRYITEKIFNEDFSKSRPEWLKNEITGGQLELDGYNERLKIAFEFNGPQHYMYYPKYHKSYQDFIYRQELDAMKRERCALNGVTLIEVPFSIDYDDFQEFIIKEYEKQTGERLKKEPKYDWRKFKQDDQTTLKDFL